MELNGQYCKFFGYFAKIYALTDADDHIFYVGMTTSPLQVRLTNHLTETNYPWANSAKCKKIRALKRKVLIKTLDIIWLTGDTVNANLSKAKALEVQWIRKMIDAGIELTNRQKTGRSKIELAFQEDYDTWASIRASDRREEEKAHA